MIRGWVQHGLLCVLLTITLTPAQAAKVEFFDDVDAGPQTLGTEEHRYLAFGEVMYHYYRNANFAAASLLLTHQHQQLFDNDTDYAELVLGDLYVSYGLPDKAEAIFNRLLAKDILSRTRAQTWFHKASLHYREGDDTAAAVILDGEHIQGLTATDEARRKLMLANILMRDGDFTDALTHLHAVPFDTDEGRYATYNMAVALIRAGQRAQGLELLGSLLTAGGTSKQALALRDRAALAAGLTALKDGDLEKARADLRQVRSNGPFSEDALLALGLANYRAGDLKRALPLWLEAVRRNSNHPSVQEALMLAPRAYEELGGLPQALSGYQYAATQYRQALKDIQRTIDTIARPGWSTALLPDDIHTAGGLPANTDDMAKGGELPYLYRLFASNRFAQRFEHYRQVQQIKTMVEHWQASLPALQESYQLQNASLNHNLPHVRAQVAGLMDRQEALRETSNTLAAAIPNYVDLENPAQVASAEQAIMWKKMDALTRHFGQIPGSNHHNAIRLRRARGLLLWDIAHQSVEQREQQVQAATLLREESQILAQRIAAVSQQIRDATLRTRDNLGQRLAAQDQKIQQIKHQTEDTLLALEQSMQADALALLRGNQQTIAGQLAEAHLAIARLQDASVSAEVNQRKGS